MIKNIIFDVGNVLIDFRWHAYMQDLGFPEELIEEFRDKMIFSNEWHKLDEGTMEQDDAIAYFKSIMPQHIDKIDIFWDNFSDIVAEYEYARPMIRSLKDSGYKVFLLSNYPKQMADLHWPTFSFINDVDGYIISAEEKLVKPDPAIYERLMERYGLNASECVFLDDLPVNVEAAKALGMKGIVFTGYEQAIRELEI